MSLARPIAVFRTDASAEIGGGHLVRCLTLAQTLRNRGWHCVFATIPAAERIVPLLVGEHFERIEMPLSHNRQIGALQCSLSKGIDLLVVDHYGLDYTFESECRAWTKRIFVIDDLANRFHSADLLLDQTYQRETSDYESYVSENCVLLVGVEYALLRTEFRTERLTRLKTCFESSGPKRILISFGSTDTHQLTVRALEAIRLSGLRLDVDVVMGAAADSIDLVKQLVKELPNARLHIDTNEIYKLMSCADFALGAGGTSSWERCCLGLPTLVVIDADNQIDIIEKLSENKAVVPLGWHHQLSAHEIAEKLVEFASQPERIQRMAHKASEICDGLGVERVADVIDSFWFKNLAQGADRENH